MTTRFRPTVAAQKTVALSPPSVVMLHPTLNGSRKGSVIIGGGVADETEKYCMMNQCNSPTVPTQSYVPDAVPSNKKSGVSCSQRSPDHYLAHIMSIVTC